MHQPMLDNHVPVLFRRLALFERTVDAFTHARVVTLNLDGGGPIRGLIFRQASHWGADAELEQLVEVPMERGVMDRFAADQITVEGFEVAQIEDVSMPFRNGTIVEGAGTQQGEQFVGPLSRVGKSFGQMRFSRHTHIIPDNSKRQLGDLVYAKES